MKNWKTTLIGIATGLYPFYQGVVDAYNNGFFKNKTTLPEILLGLGLIIGGMLSKDHNVTGKALIPLMFCLGAIGANAQTSDTTNGISFQGPTLFYCTNVNHAPTTAIVACVGIQYRHNGLASDYSFAGQFGQGGSTAPNVISGVTVTGATASIKRLGSVTLPFRLTLGLFYNFQTRTGMYAYGGGLPVGLQ